MCLFPTWSNFSHLFSSLIVSIKIKLPQIHKYQTNLNLFVLNFYFLERHIQIQRNSRSFLQMSTITSAKSDKSWERNSMSTSHERSKEPFTWVIICCIPECTAAQTRSSRDVNPGIHVSDEGTPNSDLTSVPNIHSMVSKLT